MTYQPATFRQQGGDKFVVESGGEIEVRSGGTLDVQSGATLTDSRFTGSVSVAADELAIPVTAQYVAKTTGADAEALTLADGTPGQVLVISLVTDGGGTGTLTPTTASGFVSIAFADAGDTAALKFVDATVGWVILGTSGVAAPPAIALS